MIFINNVEIVYDKKDKDFGGVSSLMVGTPGCGKTNAICKMCMADLKNSIVVWRGKDMCQWTIFLNTACRLVFWLHNEVAYELIDRDTQRVADFRSYGEVRYWNNPEDMVSGLEKGKINVVYVKHGIDTESEHYKFINDWNMIFKAMRSRIYPDAISLHFDETEDLAPESKPGFYTKVTEAANHIKEFRKNWIHFNGAVHKETEIFWIVRNKIPWVIRMRGAKPNKNSKLYKGALQKLNVGEAYIEDDNRFDKIKFSLIGKPRNFILMSKPKED